MRARQLLAGAAILALAACTEREAGSEVDMGTFGNANMNNTLVHTGQRDYVVALQDRFSKEVPDTITFAFNSATLDAEAIRVLRNQANWIRQFPELRFRVYGHTDLVGSNAYNYALGRRRAQAVVAYFASQGISRSRLEALVSFGETRPVVQTQNEERQNRRTVTEVSGFVQRHPTLLNGKYAEVIFREYLVLAERVHPQNVVQETQTNPGE
jgi:outer membrane protein OmpA-like peptidoglycan-associated protein